MSDEQSPLHDWPALYITKNVLVYHCDIFVLLPHAHFQREIQDSCKLSEVVLNRFAVFITSIDCSLQALKGLDIRHNVKTSFEVVPDPLKRFVF